MPASTPRGLTYPLSSDPPAGHTNMQTLATNTDQRLAIGGRGTYAFNASAEAAIPHGLGRIPAGISAHTVGSLTWLCIISATAANSTNFYVTLYRRDTGAIAPNTSFLISWVVW